MRGHRAFPYGRYALPEDRPNVRGWKGILTSVLLSFVFVLLMLSAILRTIAHRTALKLLRPKGEPPRTELR